MAKRVSRRQRFDEAMSQISNARNTIETLREELQEWHDNMPENLQASFKAEQLECSVDELDSLLDSLSSAEETDVEFPGMF